MSHNGSVKFNYKSKDVVFGFGLSYCFKFIITFQGYVVQVESVEQKQKTQASGSSSSVSSIAEAMAGLSLTTVAETREREKEEEKEREEDDKERAKVKEDKGQQTTDRLKEVGLVTGELDGTWSIYIFLPLCCLALNLLIRRAPIVT